jgi:hypothetical protein
MNLSKSFNMRGTEIVFEEMLTKAYESVRSYAPFHYLEIGIAKGDTILEVSKHLQLLGERHPSCTGLDLIGGVYFRADPFILRATGERLTVRIETAFPHGKQLLPSGGIRIILGYPDTEHQLEHQSIHFALIDGCHGCPCVMRDFLLIEEAIAIGGIVAFHDAGLDEQGTGHQPHCNEPLNVHKALVNLRLITRDFKDTRPGWRYLRSVDGDKSPGNAELNGHGFAFFQRLDV